MEIIQKLKENKLINKNDKVSPWVERKISVELKNEVLQETSFLEYNPSISDRIKILQLGIKCQPKCQCGSPTKYEKCKKQFLEFCSPSCVGKFTKNEKLDTNEKKFGVRSFFPTITEEQRIINASNAQIKGKVALFEKYGVDNPMFIPEVKEKHTKSVRTEEVQNRRIFTLSGLEKHYNYDKTVWGSYSKAVWHWTRHSGYHELPNYNKRGRSGVEGAYQLDHKVSIFEGFVKGICPTKIGALENLQFIPWEENRAKSCKFT